jgi:hypothetical protein
VPTRRTSKWPYDRAKGFGRSLLALALAGGFLTYPVLELALYHSLGKLPEPELTHGFF